jgi:hypothetical protein
MLLKGRWAQYRTWNLLDESLEARSMGMNMDVGQSVDIFHGI